MQLCDQYRPRQWSDVVAQDRAIARIHAAGRRGYGGRAWWITGASGTGKTSLAYLIAGEVGPKWATIEMDGGQLGAGEIDQIERSLRMYALGKGRAWIINEAHGLRAPMIRRLLVLLERLPADTAIIFTTTHDAQVALFDDKLDSGPLLSRCTVIALSRQGLCKPFAEHLMRLAVAEGLDGRPATAYEKLLKDHANNLRAAMQEVESGAMLL